MKLKQIDMLGFKSFQKRTTFYFDSNLIGVVGPNGSGKSNIIDAIRWILGEQSAKNLRGGSMKDIIFSGTEEEKGKNFAEVSIVFEDETNSSRSITRRLYKNGDSDYFIDNKRVRLKEITNLYLNYGISKESYSIITQGKVESLLSSKPLERRGIIEEAAGVLKYKNRKKETDQKLEKATDNLKRLNDIFLEITSRYEMLSEQKIQTEKYIEYSEQLKNKDILLTIDSIENNKYKLEKIYIEKNNVEKIREKLEIDEKNFLLDIETIKNKIIKLDSRYTQYKEEELLLVKRLEELKANINMAKIRKTNTEQKSEKNKEEKEYLISKKNDILLKLKEKQNLLEEYKNKKSNINKILEETEVNSSQQYEDLEKIIEELKDRYYNLVNEETKIQNNILIISKEEKSNNENIKLIEDVIKNIEEEIKKKTSEFSNFSNQKQKLEKELISLEGNFEKYFDQNLKVEENLKIVEKKIEQGKELYDSLKYKKQFLENQENNLSIYNIGVKEILSIKNENSGIYDIVANIIYFDSKFSIALDTALSASQQSIIVSNPNVARMCVEHLKRKNKGRATFLPLDSVKNKSIPVNIYKLVAEQEGFISIASNIVKYDKIYENIVTNLLGLVLIVDNLKNANIIAKLIDYKYRIITLDGQIINSGGAITGGAIYKNNSVIKNKAELIEINNDVEKVSNKLSELQKEKERDNKSLEKLKKSLSDLLESKQKINLEIKEIELNNNLISKELETKNINLENEKFKLKDYFSEVGEGIRISELDNRILEINTELKIIDNKLKEKNKKKEVLKIESDKLLEEISTYKIEKSTIEENIKHLNEIILSLKNDLKETMNQLDKISNENNLLSLEEEDQLIKISKDEKDNVENKIKELNNLLNDLRYEKENNYSLEKSLLKQQSINSEKLKVENFNLENILKQEIRLETKLDELLNYLVEKYKTTYESKKELMNDGIRKEIGKYREDVEQLKNSINLLGNVNHKAIEEFDEIKERYDFYNTQINDLYEAKDKLEKTIKEIDKEVKDRFLVTFNEVNLHFEEIFKLLFNGGKAKMYLDNPNDLLNTGIVIEVSPPGKKLQNISLLSGGEKSLTAISLLFAILKVKDSPFVILDEVEAALDEVNVTRFAKFLKIYSENNQFLVITHRRGTMEVMDKLYGVTMKEKGISYIIPLNLNEIIERG